MLIVIIVFTSIFFLLQAEFLLFSLVCGFFSKLISTVIPPLTCFRVTGRIDFFCTVVIGGHLG